MVGRTFLMLSLFASLSLSGCLGGDDGEAESLDAASDGNVDAKTPGAPGDAVAAGNVTPVAEPFSWEGSVGNQATVCAVVTCQGTSPGTWDNSHDLTGLVAGDLRLTWDTPNELAFGLARSCDGGCDFVVTDSGGSPTALSFSDLDPDHTYLLVVWHPYRSNAGTAGVQVGPQGTFQVEGTLMTVPGA